MLGVYKKHPQAYLLYVEDCFLLSDNADTRIFAKDIKKVILNSKAFQETDDKELQGFLRYVKTGIVTTEYTGRIEQMIQTVKRNEQLRKEYHVLPAALMDAFDEGEERGKSLGLAEGEARGKSLGLAEGSRQAKLETAKTMLTMGYPLVDICKISGLAPDEVQSIGNV